MIDTDERALLPCPFCGGKPLLSGPANYPWIECQSCWCTSDSAAGSDAAIAAWNRRIAQPDQSEPVAWTNDSALRLAKNGGTLLTWNDPKTNDTPLYTHPDRTQAPNEDET